MTCGSRNHRLEKPHPMPHTLEERTAFVKHLLGLRDPTDPPPSQTVKLSPREYEQVARELGKLLTLAAYHKMVAHPAHDAAWHDPEFFEALWSAVVRLVKERPVVLQPKMSGWISNGLTAQQAPLRTSAGQPVKRLTKTPAASPTETTPEPPPTHMSPAPVPGSAWKWQPIPLEPDPHDDTDDRDCDTHPGYRLFGARVRGKKHKHDGTSCDDWFDLAHVAGWNIVAVADGAGSKRFSRVGAKVACERAAASLAAEASGLIPPPLDLEGWTKVLNDRGPDNRFGAEFLVRVVDLLHAAVRAAYDAVEEACRQRQADAAYAQLLGRPIEIGDLSATLLLALHRPVRVGEYDLDLVLACQVGDGMTAAVHRNGSVMLLGRADGGEFSGETEFLTSAGKRDTAYLHTKTFVQLGGFQAVLVMTDGVADDYFPNDPHLGRLWADLLLNRIPKVRPNPATPQPADGSDPSVGDTESEIISNKEPREKVLLRSCAKLAEVRGVPAEELARRFGELYHLGSDALCEFQLDITSPARRLRLWLDAYFARGSFDDRTLVVLHREALP